MDSQPTQFSSKWHLGEYVIQRCDSHRVLLIDSTLVRFTPTEYELVTTLFEQSGKPVPFEQLVHRAFHCELDHDMRRLLDKHLDRIRSKLRPFSIGIYCIVRYGYILLSEKNTRI
ncbi:MAG: helix-turn-helix domain-containing protein [Ktedonobacteraceae bacterium]|nr:helix-turn-helix domain-containing protein [Ktedonobacteraceae bacterium]